jgi:hypothetical protein
MQQFKRRTLEYAGILPIVTKYAVNEIERSRAMALDREIVKLLGQRSMKERLRRVIITAMAMRWKLRCRFLGDEMQPSTIVTKFKADAKNIAAVSSTIVPFPSVKDPLETASPNAAVASHG